MERSVVIGVDAELKDDSADVAADVVADNYDRIVPEDIVAPLSGANKINDVCDAVVEAADDKERHSEQYRQDRFRGSVEPYRNVDNQPATDRAKEAAPRSLSKSGSDRGLGTLGRFASQGENKQPKENAAEDIEEPYSGKGRDIIHNARTAGVKRHAGEHDADKPEGEYYGPRQTTESEVSAGSQPDQNTGK